MTRLITCTKYKTEMLGLEKPPFPTEKGSFIFDNLSQQAWNEWMTLQKKLINEKHLNLRSKEDKQYLDEQFTLFINNEATDTIHDQ